MTGPQPAKVPSRVILDGRYTRLEPLGPQHADDLFAAATPADAAQRFAYLPSYPPVSVEATRDWIVSQQELADPILFAVVDKATGRAGGWQQLMRIVPKDGVIEICYVYWGPEISRTRSPPKRSIYLPATSSRTSAIAASSGNAMTATNRAKLRRSAWALPMRGSSAST